MGLRHIILGKPYSFGIKPKYTHSEINALDILDNVKERLCFDADANAEGKVIVIIPQMANLRFMGNLVCENFWCFCGWLLWTLLTVRKLAQMISAMRRNGRIFDYGFTL